VDHDENQQRQDQINRNLAEDSFEHELRPDIIGTFDTEFTEHFNALRCAVHDMKNINSCEQVNSLLGAVMAFDHAWMLFTSSLYMVGEMHIKLNHPDAHSTYMERFEATLLSTALEGLDNRHGR